MPDATGLLFGSKALHRMLAAFTYRDFRVQWFGACTSSIGTWMQIVAQNWSDAKEQFARRLLDQAAEHAPDIRDLIIGRAIETPEDIERINPNFVGGDCVSGSHHRDQNFLWRPVFGWSRYATPIKQLYMIGASTWPGGGVNAGSGYLVAQRLLSAPAADY